MAAATSTRNRTGTLLATRGPGLVGLEVLAHDSGVHPELARRLIRLGLVEAHGGTRATPLFLRQDAVLLARAMRLRRDLGLNYAGAVFASELLARIDELERRLTEQQREVITWTRTD